MRHFPAIAANFGTLVNVSVALKEAMHGIYKKFIPHTNKKDLSKDIAKRDNTLQTLRYLMDGGSDARYNGQIGELFSSLANDTKLHQLLNGWYIGTPLQYDTQEDNSTRGLYFLRFSFSHVRFESYYLPNFIY